jgi:hypothetical protein
VQFVAAGAVLNSVEVLEALLDSLRSPTRPESSVVRSLCIGGRYQICGAVVLYDPQGSMLYFLSNQQTNCLLSHRDRLESCMHHVQSVHRACHHHTRQRRSK